MHHATLPTLGYGDMAPYSYLREGTVFEIVLGETTSLEIFDNMVLEYVFNHCL